MDPFRGIVAAALATSALLACAAPAGALAAGSPGGVQAPSSGKAGGIEYGAPSAVPAGPVISSLSVPASALAGAPPKVTLRLDETGVATVRLRVSILNLATRHTSLLADMGWSRTGRTLTVRWPAGASLAPGSYQLRVSARDHRGVALVRRAHSSGRAALTVRAVPSPPPAPTPAPEAGVPTPAQSLADGAVFPVAGAHSFGNAENRFGAPRGSHVHEGQDVLAAEGTPVLAPLAGAIESTAYQAGGAGYYVVEHTTVGFDLFFAHCEAASFAVSSAQGVTAGQLLCHAGQTGDASAPHLHFEMWVGGWQAAGGHPIDPLPYLQAWDREGATG